MVGAADDQVTKFVIFSVPFLHFPVAVSCNWAPAGASGAPGVMAIEIKPVRVPVPVRLALSVLKLALSLTVRAPVLKPGALGVNVIEILQLAPAANVCGETGQDETLAKSPDVAIPKIVSGPP